MSRATAAVASWLLLAAVALAACGSSSSSQTHGGSNTQSGTFLHQAGGAGAIAPTTPSHSKSIMKLGCDQFCLQAGGYGGGGSQAPNMTKILSTRVVSLPDGTVPITIRCLYRLACLGAVSISSGAQSGPLVSACSSSPAVPGAKTLGFWAQSDLQLPAHTALTEGLTLSSCAQRLLGRHHRLVITVTADAGQTYSAAPKAERQRLVPIDGATVTLLAP